jgi:enamidase
MSKVMIRNIGTLVSGAIERPLLDADAIWIEDGIIRKVGASSEMDEKEAHMVIDCNGTTVCPGLMDSHCHPVLGDFTPRQLQVGFLDSEIHGGVTTIISAGEVHLPGRPKDPAGTKALAVLASKSFANFRPGGAKVLAGALILERGLEEEDFSELASQGVRIVGEIGLGSVKSPREAAHMVRWAKKHGMVVMMHAGGTSIPGSSTVTADEVMQVDPDIVSHINGGPTAVSMREVERLVKETSYALEFVHCGNPKVAVEAARLMVEHEAQRRAIVGNDAPSGTGVVPLGILRVLNLLCSLSPIEPHEALCMASGNTARIFKLNRGIIEAGREADIVVMDAPMGSVGRDALEAISAGDVPAVSLVMVDGQIVVQKSRNTPPPKRSPSVRG